MQWNKKPYFIRIFLGLSWNVTSGELSFLLKFFQSHQLFFSESKYFN